MAIFQRRIFVDRKMTVLLLLEGILYIEGIEIGLDLISERKVEFQYMCGKTSFKTLSVELLFPSGHHMLIIGLYHPPSYDEGDLTDFIIDRCDTFLDIHPNGVVL